MDQIDLEAIGVSPLDEHNARLLDNVHPQGWLDPEPKPSYNMLVIGAGAGGLVSAAEVRDAGRFGVRIEGEVLI
jgi:hypothetical protein